MFNQSQRADLSTLASRAAQTAMPRRGSMMAKLEANSTQPKPLPALTVVPVAKHAPALTLLPPARHTPVLTVLPPVSAETVSAWQVAAAKIVVIGAGGAGGNAVGRMVDQPSANIDGIRFTVANTDAQALKKIECESKVTLGPKVTRGLGAGGKAEVGARAAEESIAEIEEMIADADLVFITLGLGGGTGSGAAPVIARVAREKGAVVVAFATLPFAFEGNQRAAAASVALENLRASVDTVVVVNNDALLSLFEKGKHNVTLPFAFSVADQCLQQAVDGMVGIIRHPGTINLDFADVRSTLAHGGRGYFGMGIADGENAAARAMEKAMTSHLLGRDGVSGAKKVLVYFRGDAGAKDLAEAMTRLDAALDLECETFFGCGPDSEMGEQVEVTLFAVGVTDSRAGLDPAAAAPNRPRPQAPVAIAVPVMADIAPQRIAVGASVTTRLAPEPADVPKFLAVRVRQSSEPAAENRPAVAEPVRTNDAALPPILTRGRDKAEKSVKHSYHLTTDQTDHCFREDLDVPAFLRRRARQ